VDENEIVIQYDFDDAPTVQQFVNSNAPRPAIMGPFGSGKSTGCIIKLLRECYLQWPDKDGVRRVRSFVVRNTYRQLEDTTIRTFMEWLPETHFGEYNKKNHNYMILGLEGVEWEVLFRALDRPDHVQNLLSLEVTNAWLNEARELPWAVVEALWGRLGRFPSKRSGKGARRKMMIMDTNPPPENSWFADVYIKRPRKGFVLYRQPGGMDKNAENRKHLPDRYYEDLLEVMDEETARVYVHGELGVIKRGMRVYPEYREQIHSRGNIEPISHLTNRRLWRGWDFGLTPACVIAQVNSKGQLRALVEFTTDRAGIDAFSDLVLRQCSQWFRGYMWDDVGDPSGKSASQTREESCFDILEAKGINIRPASNNLNRRIESVRKGLTTLIDGEPALIVNKKGCPVLHEGFMGGYYYRPILVRDQMDERYAQEPEKNKYSHPHDALQYICEEVFGYMLDGLNKSEIERQQPIQITNSPVVAALRDDAWDDEDIDWTGPERTDSDWRPW